MDTEHSYYARVLDEVERLQPVGAGGGILVLNLMYPCFETGARVGMDLSVRSGEDAFPVGTWKVGRPYTNRYIHCPVRTAGRKVSRCGLPLVAPLDRLNGITGLTWTVTVDLPLEDRGLMPAVALFSLSAVLGLLYLSSGNLKAPNPRLRQDVDARHSMRSDMARLPIRGMTLNRTWTAYRPRLPVTRVPR